MFLDVVLEEHRRAGRYHADVAEVGSRAGFLGPPARAKRCGAGRLRRFRRRAGTLSGFTFHVEAPLGPSGGGLPASIDLAAGGAHACALGAAEHVRCWGDGTHGELGDGTFTSRNVLAPVTGLP